MSLTPYDNYKPSLHYFVLFGDGPTRTPEDGDTQYGRLNKIATLSLALTPKETIVCSAQAAHNPCNAGEVAKLDWSTCTCIVSHDSCEIVCGIFAGGQPQLLLCFFQHSDARTRYSSGSGESTYSPHPEKLCNNGAPS